MLIKKTLETIVLTLAMGVLAGCKSMSTPFKDISAFKTYNTFKEIEGVKTYNNKVLFSGALKDADECGLFEYDLFIFNQGGKIKRLTKTPAFNEDGCWTKDGKIVYLQCGWIWEKDDWNWVEKYYKMDSDGNNKQEISWREYKGVSAEDNKRRYKQ